MEHGVDAVPSPTGLPPLPTTKPSGPPPSADELADQELGELMIINGEEVWVDVK